MTSKQNAKLNMAQRVSDTLTAYSEVYAGIEPMKNAAAGLQQIITGIREIAVEQIAVQINATTNAKRAAEERMIDSAIRIANALYVIGFESGNEELINLLGLSDSSFYRVEDNAKLTLARRLYDLAREHAPALVPYGYNESRIAETGAAIEEYGKVIAIPMDAIARRKQKTTNMKEMFARLDSMLYDKLDRLIVLFKASHPDFYSEYRTARNFINSAAHHRQKEETDNTVQ